MAKKKNYNLILYELQQEAIRNAALTGNKKISNEQLEKQAQDEHLAPLKNASMIKRNPTPTKKSPVKIVNVNQKSLKKVKPNTFKRTWFKSGAFEDGYQIGDISKTISGTITDLSQDIVAGTGRIAEATIDTGAYLLGGGAKLLGKDKFASSMQEFIKKDLINEEKLGTRAANNNPMGWANNLLNGNYKALNPFSKEASNSKTIESNSLLGEKTDSLMQSGGQLAATLGLQAVGVPWWLTTGTTSFGSGAEEAFNEGATYGEAGFSAAVTTGAEILTEKLSGGISFGGATLDDALLKPLTEKISNKTLKVLTNLGIDAFGEGAEEVVSSVISRVGKKLSYEDEKTWGEILTSEEALDEYLEGFVGGAALGGSFSAINSIKKNNIAPVDNTAQIEGLQQAIAKETEELNKSQDAREKQIRQEKIEQLNTELNELTNAQTITDESELRKRHFTYQAQETDSDIRKTVYESASKVMNDTEMAHKLVDVVAKIAEERGTIYEFTNTEEIKKGNHNVGDNIIDGFVQDGKVKINVDSPKFLNVVVGHETTHLLENKDEQTGEYSKEYQALKQIAIEYAKTKGDYDARVEKLTKLYEGTNADIEAELTSDIVGEYLFTDYNFVKELSVKQPTLFEKIKNFISDLVVKFTGTEQEKQLRQLQRSFEKAYKAQGTQTTDTKYSLNDNQGRTLTKEQQEYFKDSKVRDENGNLLTVYHGTEANAGIPKEHWFNIFDIDKSGRNGNMLGEGFYFTTDEAHAKQYAHTKGNIYETYLDIKNPLELDYLNSGDLAYNIRKINPYVEADIYKRNGEIDGYKVRRYLMDNGYDGIHVGNTWVAFNSNQIKNVDNTNPTSNPDIRYSLSEDNQGEYNYQSHRPKVRGGWTIEKIQRQLKTESSYNKPSVAVMDYTDIDEFKNNVYYHGSANFHNNLKAGSTIGEDFRGGGYGEEYHSISLSRSKNRASNFTGTAHNGVVTPVLLRKGANVIEMTDIEDSIELEDMLPELWEQKVDAVKIGDWDSEYSEQEIVILNPRAITVLGDYAEHYPVYHKPKFENMSNSEIQEMYSHYQEKYNNLHSKINMSLSAQNEEIAPTGNWNVRGEDIKYQVEEAIAPLQEKIESLTEQLDTVLNSVEQQTAPIQETKPTRPTLEEVQNLMDIKENQSGSDYARAFFALRDKYGQPNLYKSLNEYNKTGTITEDTTEDYAAPVSQEVVEKQGQEAFNAITDEQAPKVDVNNMSFEDAIDSIMMDYVPETDGGTEVETKSPLDSRDIDEVGNRKVKAYQYENPEVKPYFQAEAQAMLGDLDSTIKGVRSPVLDQDGYITGWYGLERQTTEAIGYLKDKYGYSYEQIRKGLNAIIEDDGKENNAVSKRIEFMLDERLREGYTTSDGFPIPPNEEYINFLNEKQITEYNKEAFNALTDSDVPLEQTTMDVEAKTETVKQLIPMTEKTAQNRNMSEEYLAIAPEKTSEPKMLRVKEPQKLGKVEGRVTEPTIPEPIKDAKQLTLDGTEEDLVAKTKKQLRRELIEPNKEFFANALDNAKNRSMAFMNNTDTIRNTELVFGREAGKVINDVIFQKEIDNEADSIAWQNKERQEIKDLGIKARSKESAAVQKYGEKQYVNDEGKLVPYGDAELAKEFTDIDTQNKIKRAAQVIRNKYDNYIDEANEVLTKLGFDPIKKRKDYMRHFQELTDVFSRNGIPFNAKNMQEHVLPTDINGLTEFWSPQKNYFASMQARKGIKTNYDAITGIDGYIGGISNLIFHTEDIQRGRAFEELIRETYGESKGWENLEKLPNELKQARAEKIQDNHLSNYAAWVHEWTNNVAGKKNKLDRSVEAVFGRKAFSFLDEVRKQVGSNMIGFNVSSSLTNLLAPVQAMSKTNKLAMAKGTADTIKNIFVKDNFVDNNKFLTSRFGTDMLSKNAWQKIQDAGYVFMKGVDWFSSNQIVRSKYYELRAKGLSEADAHAQAGQFAARIMGDRTKGAAPQLYNSKLVGLVTQFQLEVNNQLYSQFYDTYQESKEHAKGNALKTAAGMTFTLGQIFAFTHLFGQTFESIAGYNPSFDIIEMIKTAFGWGDDEEEEKTTSERLKSAADQLVDALPYVNILTGGGRIPIASGIPNLVGVATGGTDDYGNELTLEDELKKLLLLLPPTGGNQVKKTVQGLSMYDEDLPIAGSYTDSGNLRYTVEDNIPSKLQAGLFGKWANKNAQAYIDSDFKTIDKDNIEELVELDFDSNEYRKYKEGLNEIKRMELEDGEAIAPYLFDYIDSQDVTEEQKSIMIKHLLSDEESEDLSGLDMSTEQTIDYYDAKSRITQEIAEYSNDKSLLTGDTESEEYKEAVSGLSDEKKSNIIDTIKNTNLSDTQKAYLYGKYYSSDKTLDKVIDSGISFDDYLTYSKDSLSLESTEEKAEYLFNANLTDEAKTVIYETSVLSGFDNEDKYKDYKTVKAAEVDINSWLSYKKQEFVADKDSSGKSISGSRKDKIISYVNSLNLSKPQKAIMIRTEYSTFDDYNNQIVSYINDLDLNYEEKVKILENLDFTIGKDGFVYWD
jgi:hypothetical protein